MAETANAVRAMRLRDGYMNATGRVRASVLHAVAAAWEQTPELRDADVGRLVERLAPQVIAGQLQLANLTSAFLAQQAALLRGIPVKPARVDRKEILGVRAGIPIEELLHRPAVTVYTELAVGATYENARKAGFHRLISIAGTQLQLAKTHQARKALETSGATYFRRVLSGSENCKICVLAATQRYRTGRLADIHPGCDCGVEELPRGETPERIIDPQLLKAVNSLTDEDGKPLGTRDLITVHEHGELGPVLTWKKHDFATITDIKEQPGRMKTAKIRD